MAFEADAAVEAKDDERHRWTTADKGHRKTGPVTGMLPVGLMIWVAPALYGTKSFAQVNPKVKSAGI